MADESPLSAVAAGPAAAVAPVTWAEQDETLRDMWQRGEVPTAIAAALNRSVAAVMTRAARLGLQRRFAPGRKPSRRNYDAAGMAAGQPRNPLPRTPYQAPATARPTVERVCLMCLTKFPSQGAHNRICNSCKGSREYEAGSRLPDMDYAG